MVDELNITITKIVGFYSYFYFFLKKKVKNVNRKLKTNNGNDIQPVARCME